MNPYADLGVESSELSTRLLRGRVELGVTQARLGTAAERPDDIDHARALAHEIANILTAITLKASFRTLTDAANGRPHDPGRGRDREGLFHAPSG